MNKLTIATDAAHRLIRVTGTGMWTPDAAEAHFIALERAVTDMRRACGRAFVLVDLRRAHVQTAQTARVISAATRRIYKSADRVAIVLAAQLLALQLKRAVEIEHFAYFADVESALDWIGVHA